MNFTSMWKMECELIYIFIEELLVKLEANLSDHKSLVNVPVIVFEKGTILLPYETLYLPLWHRREFHSPRASDKNDINLTNLLSKAITTNYQKVFRSDDIKSEGELFTRTTHNFNFYQNGTFLRDSYIGKETKKSYISTFGLYSIKEGLIFTEFYDLSQRKTIKEQVLTMISDSQIKFEDNALKASDGKIIFSGKLLAVFDKSYLEGLNIDFSSILNLLCEKAELTKYEGSFSYSSSENWDDYEKDIKFFPNGTCKLRVYKANHDYSNVDIYFGNYSTKGNKFNLNICTAGEIIPSLLKLTVGETVELGVTLT